MRFRKQREIMTPHEVKCVREDLQDNKSPQQKGSFN